MAVWHCDTVTLSELHHNTFMLWAVSWHLGISQIRHHPTTLILPASLWLKSLKSLAGRSLLLFAENCEWWLCLFVIIQQVSRVVLSAAAVVALWRWWTLLLHWGGQLSCPPVTSLRLYSEHRTHWLYTLSLYTVRYSIPAPQHNKI